jgi:hypothetical protein
MHLAFRLTFNGLNPRPTGRIHTPQVPPNPTVTLPCSTMTGTSRPPERRIILSSSFLSCLTLI